MQSKYAPIRLSIQKIVGESTRLAFSDNIHCTNMRVEKKTCARNPMVNMNILSILPLYVIFISYLVIDIAFLHPPVSETIHKRRNEPVP